MSNFRRIDGVIGGQALDATSTSQANHLGESCVARDMATTDYGVGEFIYAKGLDSTAIGEVVIIDADDFSTKLATANDVGRIGFSMSVNPTSSYGWYQVRGKCVALAATSCADNAALYLTSTAGTLDDAVVAGDRIHSTESASAVDTPSSGLTEVDADYPHTDNIAD